VELREPFAVECATDLAARAHRPDDARAAEAAEVPREERLREAEPCGERRHGVLTLGREQLQDAQAGVVTERPVVRAQIARGSFSQHNAPHFAWSAEAYINDGLCISGPDK